MLHIIKPKFNDMFLLFQMTKLQAAIKYGEEDLPAAKVIITLFYQQTMFRFYHLVTSPQ